MFAETLVIGALALGAFAQNATSTAAAQTTQKLLAGNTNEHLVASVVAADNCDTTYAMRCTEGTFSAGELTGTCTGQTYMATYGSDFYEVSSGISSDGAEVTVSASCSLAGTTSAVCVESISLSVDGKQTKTVTTGTLTGAQLPYQQVPITAGASKLAGATGSCTVSGNAAAATGIREIYKVMVFPGAAALLAGAAAFV